MEKELKAILERLDKLDMKIDIKLDMGFDDLKEVMERQQEEKRQGFADINKAIDMLNKRLKG